MNERQSNREDNLPPAPLQRDVYRETRVDETSASLDDDVVRDVYQERVSGPDGDQVTRSEHVSVPSDATRRRAGITRAKQIVYFIFGVINVLILLRFILLLLGAQEQSSFVSLIYGMSRPLVLPFQGIFAEPTLGGSVLEWASLVGIAIYSLIAYGIARVITLIYAPQPTATRAE